MYCAVEGYEELKMIHFMVASFMKGFYNMNSTLHATPTNENIFISSCDRRWIRIFDTAVKARESERIRNEFQSQIVLVEERLTQEAMNK